MRRVVLLAVLALALPTVAMASTFDFGNAGTLGTTASMSGSATVGGTITLTSVLTSIDNNGVMTTGNLGTVSMTTGTLAACGTGCFTFTGGTVDIWNSSSQLLFHGTFNGTVTVVGGVISVMYQPGGSPVIGGFQVSAAGVVSGDTIVTPEPGTLGLLGTGLVGLAGLVRRKLRR
jgi:PEP-CTERM motif